MVKSALISWCGSQRGGPNVCKCQLGMGRQNLADMVKDATGCETIVLNDADAAGLAECGLELVKIMAMILCCF